MMDAEPMTMPSIVSRKRILLARKLSTASRTTSLNIMVERALASVRSNEPVLEEVIAAICFAMGRLKRPDHWTSFSIAAVQYFLPTFAPGQPSGNFVG
jgi:hypothetical protein